MSPTLEGNGVIRVKASMIPHDVKRVLWAVVWILGYELRRIIEKNFIIVQVFIPYFSEKRPDFSAKCKIFGQIHRNVLKKSKVHPTRHLTRRTETYPILETFLFLFTTRRFGGVGAPEGRDQMPDHNFLQIKKNCVSGGRLWNQPDFLQICVSGGRL